MGVATSGMILNLAYQMTEDSTYLDTSRSNLHYLLGNNAMGECFVTGYGTVSPEHPHHRPSMAKNHIAAIEAEQLRKKQEKAKRAAEVQKQKKAALMKAVEAGDPEAIAEYERKLALQRERNHRRQQKITSRDGN